MIRKLLRNNHNIGIYLDLVIRDSEFCSNVFLNSVFTQYHANKSRYLLL